MNRPPVGLRPLLASLTLLACVSGVKADQLTWSLGTDGNWNSAANWTSTNGTTHALPTTGDTARIATTTLQTVTVNTAVPAFGNLQMGNITGGQNKGSLYVTTGGTLSSTGLVTTDQSNGVSLIVQDGGSVTFGSFGLGRINGSGTTRYTMQGGFLTVTATMAIGASSASNIGSGTFNQTGGTVTAQNLVINKGTSTANSVLYSFSGGTLATTTHLVNGIVGSSTTALRIVGSTGTILIGGNYSQNNNATLGVQVDNGGLTKLNLTSASGTATLSGTLSAGFKGSVAFTSGTSFRVVEAETITGDFTTKPSTTLWNTGTQADVSGTKDAYVLSYSAGAEVGPDIIGGGDLTFSATSVGYATITSLSIGQPISLYLDANAGGGSIAGLVAYLMANGFTASQVSLGAYDILLSLTPQAATSYFAWDLSGYNPTATFSGLSVVPEPGTAALLTFAGLTVMIFRRQRRALPRGARR